MAAIWKTKVLPKIKKIFSSDKKKALLQTKLFEKEKGAIDAGVEEKKSELQPKLLELFEAADPETKALLQSPNEAAVKEKTEATAKLLKDLAEKGFPGAQLLSDAVAKVGVASVAGPITWLLQKVSTFLPPAPTPPPEAAKEIEVPASTEKPEEVAAVTAATQEVIASTTAAEAVPEAPKAPEPVAATPDATPAPAPASEVPAVPSPAPAPAPAPTPADPTPAPTPAAAAPPAPAP